MAEQESNGMLVEVDGEQFGVERSSTDPRQLNFTWLSGPNPGYGLFSAPYGAEFLETDGSDVVLEQLIRNFLSQINPATGYID